jgi:diaminohydroxyphosphoribosylaminopyrimidine deaminase / 5-amino-6-(5-phosphoribosylamino)uracil reductase
MHDEITLDERHMQRALALSKRGLGSVEPNPMVGAVVFDASGQVVGEGWHERFGGPHAEVMAFAQAGDAAHGGTLYVTLEPCCHHGKTPPCTDVVLRSGVRRVVIAMADPFPKVAGGGIELLKAEGLEVVVGVRELKAREINAPYLKLLSTGKPWVIAKWAMSLDGKIATRTGDSKWISGEASRRKVHELRGRMDAILVGRGTVLADDPMLTARPPGQRVATRVVVTASGELPERCQLRASAKGIPVIVYTAAGKEAKLTGWAADGAEIVPILPELASADSKTGLPMGDVPIQKILQDLGGRNFTNVLVEGGASLLGSFFDADAIDEAQVYLAPKLIGGALAPSPVGGVGIDRIENCRSYGQIEFESVGGDIWLQARRVRK